MNVDGVSANAIKIQFLEQEFEKLRVSMSKSVFEGSGGAKKNSSYIYDLLYNVFKQVK